MSEPLPLFPLSAVLFPQMLMPLHIFEPRYRLLVRRCLDHQQPFVIVLIKPGAEAGAVAEPREVGTTARIVGHSPLPDGRSYIVVRGERRFAIDTVLTDAEPYLVGRVRYLEDDDGHDASDLADAAADAFNEYLMGVAAAAGEPRSEVPRL